MRYSITRLPLSLCFVFIISCLITSCASLPITQNKSKAMNQIVDDYFEASLKLDPLYATSIGDHRFDDQLAITISDEHLAKSLSLIEDSLHKIQTLTCAGLRDQDSMTCQSFIADLEASLELEKSDLTHLMPINQFDTFFADFAELAAGSSYVTFDTEKDYENFLSRIHRVPEYIDVSINNMKIGIKNQVTTPQILIDRSIKQLRDLLPVHFNESVFYKPLLTFDQKIKTPVSPDLKARYSQSIQSVIYPAYQKLLEYLEKEYRPLARTTHGLMAVPGGRRNYLALVRFHTTLSLDPNLIMELGLREVDRISRQFEEVKNQLGFKGRLTDFFKSLRANPKLFPFKSGAEVLTAYQGIYDRVMARIPEHFRLLPKAKFEIREVEKFKAENASEAYQNGSPDGSRPGVFWVPVPHPEAYNIKSMESLFLHEAIPGHHFQISIQQELTQLPRYRRFESNNAYAEGWALYTESLGKDLGLYADPYQWIGRLEGDMHRAIRLVVDVGMHWKGWSRNRAIQYSLDHEPGDLASITSEIERYLAIPGQALSYKMGEQKILELKALAKSTLGQKYSDADFHDQVLKDGALPLSVFEAKLKAWIQGPRP